MAYRRKSNRRYRRSRRTKYGRRMGRRTFQSRVKSVLMKNAESKFLQGGRENINLYHDVGAASGPTSSQSALIFNPWAGITSGTGPSNRVGEKITPTMMVARLWLANKDTRPNLLYRVIVARMPRMVGGVITSGGNVDLFRVDDVGFNGNTLCGMIDNEKGIRCYYDRTIRNEIGYSESTAAGKKECHKFLKLKIKRKRKTPILFEPGGNITNNPVAIFVIPYDSYGTLQTDNIASCAITYRLYFKDI